MTASALSEGSADAIKTGENMYKEMVITALNAKEVSLNLQSQVRRKGGIENLTEETAKTICTICRLKPEEKPSPEEEAYQEYRKNEESIRFWNRLRADLGEAHSFGDMCGYDASDDREAHDRYTREIETLQARQEKILDLARKGARQHGRKL